MTSETPAATFDTTLSANGNNTGIVVPPEVLQQLGAGKRPAVAVDVNGYSYFSTVGVMAGRSLVSVSAAVRKVTGLAAGDPIRVTLTVNDTPREVDVPADFAEALRSHPGIERFYQSLPNSLQRYHLDQIAGAKTTETRQRRIDKSIALFLEGKKR
ncbi:MAG: YdeI/OmpD-associated family protein [Rhodoglobus sp.]